MGEFVIGMHVVGAYKQRNTIYRHMHTIHNLHMTRLILNYARLYILTENTIEQEQHNHRSLVTYKHCGGEGEHHFPRPFLKNQKQARELYITSTSIITEFL